MLIEIVLILAAYYMGKKGMTLDEVYYLAKNLLEKDDDEAK